MSFFAVICGLKSEAAAVRRAMSAGGFDEARVRIGVSGANAARAEEIARGFAREGAGVILSVGVSGGLDPALVPGDLVVSTGIIGPNGPIKSIEHPSFSFLSSALPGESRGPDGCGDMDPGFRRDGRECSTSHPLFGSDEVVASAPCKAQLFRETGAVAVDMESHGAARAAADAGLPFIAIRAIADPADRALPEAALNAVAPDGSTRVFRTLFEAMKSPGQFPALLQLGRDSEKALATLRERLGPILLQVLERLDRES